MNRRHTLTCLGSWALSACAVPFMPAVRTQAARAASPVPLREPQLGQQWTYAKYNVFNSQLLETEQQLVTSISPQVVIASRSAAGQELRTEKHSAWGALLQDPAWDVLQLFEQAVPLWPQTLQLHARERINTRYRTDGGSFLYWVQVQSTVDAWERVSLPLGDFDCWRVERLIRLAHPDVSRLETVRRDTFWLAPELGRWVVRDTQGQFRWPGRKSPVLQEDHVRWELLGWR